MPRRLSLDEAAAELRKSRRWLQQWLRTHPRDKHGEPFYTPAGRDKLLHDTDIARIELALREGMTCRSNSGRRGQGKRRTMKSAGPIDGSAWKQAAELLNDPTLLSGCERSKNASTPTGNGPHPRLSVIQGSR